MKLESEEISIDIDQSHQGLKEYMNSNNNNSESNGNANIRNENADNGNDKREREETYKENLTNDSQSEIKPNLKPKIENDKKKLNQNQICKNDDLHDFHQKRISVGDNLLLKLPSGQIKQISDLPSDSFISLGKYGKFKSSEILGDPFGLAYEIENDEKGSFSRLIKSIRLSSDETNEGLESTNSTTMMEYKILNVVEIEATNENIKESDGAQKMTYDDIEELKKSGLSGREIIQKQIEQHSAFELKSEFSKAKYIKRKEKKFLKSFTCIEPTIYNVNQYLFENYYYTIKGLRTDTLSQILNLSNVRPGWKGIVIDETGGLLIGAIITRMAGEGELYMITDSDSPPDLHLLNHLHLDKNKSLLKVMKSLNWLQISPLSKPKKNKNKKNNRSGGCEEEKEDEGHYFYDQNSIELDQLNSKVSLIEEKIKSFNKSGKGDGVNVVEKVNGNSIGNEKKKLERERSKLKKRINKLEQVENLRKKFFETRFESLISCSDYEPKSILKTLSKFLSFSASVTIYSQYLIELSNLQNFLKEKNFKNTKKQPKLTRKKNSKEDEEGEEEGGKRIEMMEIDENLVDRTKVDDYQIEEDDYEDEKSLLGGDFINITISEPWLRKYQVLTGRTHPEMNGSQPGGYLLSAFKVSST